MTQMFSKVAVIAAIAGILFASAAPIASANDLPRNAQVTRHGGGNGRGGAIVAGGVLAGAATALTVGAITNQQPAYYARGYNSENYAECGAYGCPPPRTRYNHCHRQRLFDQYGDLVAVRRVCR